MDDPALECESEYDKGTAFADPALEWILEPVDDDVVPVWNCTCPCEYICDWDGERDNVRACGCILLIPWICVWDCEGDLEMDTECEREGDAEADADADAEPDPDPMYTRLDRSYDP